MQNITTFTLYYAQLQQSIADYLLQRSNSGSKVNFLHTLPICLLLLSHHSLLSITSN